MSTEALQTAERRLEEATQRRDAAHARVLEVLEQPGEVSEAAWAEVVAKKMPGTFVLYSHAGAPTAAQQYTPPRFHPLSPHPLSLSQTAPP